MGLAVLMSIVVLVLSFLYLKVPKGRLKYKLITPISFVSIFIVIYMVLGFNAYWQGDYYFLDVNFSYSLNRLYEVSSVFLFLFFLSFLFFYYATKKNKFNNINEDYSLRYKYVYLYVSLTTIYSLISINGINVPLFHNFLGLFFNASLTIVSYAVITKMRGSYFLLFILSLLIIYIGFRYRLIFLYLPILISVFTFKKLRILKLLKYFLITTAAIFLVAVVGIARRYGDGLDFEKLEGIGVSDIIIKGIFNDTSTVLTSGSLIQWLDDTHNFAYFKQIWYIISYFIPNELYPNKEYSPIFEIISSSTGQNNNESGAAVLGFVEYYHTAGYYGVFIFALMFSFVFSRLFKKMVNSNSVYNHYVYFILITWYLNSLTRGYLPQNAQDLISILIGLFLIKKFSKSFNIGSYNESNGERI